MYEISREVFKQRINTKSNFAILDVYEEREAKGLALKNTEAIAYDPNFLSNVESKYPDKAQNILVYSLKSGDDRPAQALEILKNAGYKFVYYYVGDLDDKVLDKGLN
jgi:rhodanese-related sulfurtransferase